MKKLYSTPGKVVVTAHRGFSGSYPENTLTAFEKAIEIGADFVEFDVQASSDGQLLIMHDRTLDRTTDGSGEVKANSWETIRRLNASHWEGPHRGGTRREVPSGTERVPLFSEALERLSGRVGLNIQIYLQERDKLREIARLYLDHALEESGFLLVPTFDDAEWMRQNFPAVALCVGEDRGDLERHLAFGVDYIQPWVSHLNSGYVERLLAEGLPHNIFYANDEESTRALLNWGLKGIMSDCPDVVLDIVKS